MGYEAINYRICHENISSLILIRGSPKRAPADLFSVSLGHSKFCSSGVRWLPGKAAESATNKKNSEEKKRTETTETTNTEAEHSLATTTTKSILQRQMQLSYSNACLGLPPFYFNSSHVSIPSRPAAGFSLK